MNTVSPLVSRNAPVEIRFRSEHRAARNRGAIHEPDYVLAGGAVAPQDVGLAVPVEVADPRDAPVEIPYRTDNMPAQNRSAVHEPDRDLAGGAVAPQDVGLAVPIEVADSRDAPVEIRCRSEVGSATRNRGVIHEPDRVRAGYVVVPQDVGLAISVKVADPYDAPVEIRYRTEDGLAQNRGAVHEPDRDLAGGAVAPQDVGLAVSIEVADSRDAPVEIRYRSEVGSATRNRGAVHEPDRVRAGRVVMPQDVGLAVPVEIATHDRARGRRHRDRDGGPGGIVGDGVGGAHAVVVSGARGQARVLE